MRASVQKVVMRTLELMRDSVQHVRMRMHAADIQLTAAVETLITDSMIGGLKKNGSQN